MSKITIILLTFIFNISNSFAIEIQDFEHNKVKQIKNFEFIDDLGNTHNLFDSKGKVVLLNFWATWCKPCVDEMPALSQLVTTIKNPNIVIMPMSLDFKGVSEVNNFYNNYKIDNLPTYLDYKSDGFNNLEIKALPTTIIIDKNGYEVARILGQIDWNSNNVKNYLNNLLNK